MNRNRLENRKDKAMGRGRSKAGGTATKPSSQSGRNLGNFVGEEIKHSETHFLVAIPKDENERVEVYGPFTFTTKAEYYEHGVKSQDAYDDLKKFLAEQREVYSHRSDIKSVTLAGAQDAWQQAKYARKSYEDVEESNERLRKRLAKLTAKQYYRRNF